MLKKLQQSKNGFLRKLGFTLAEMLVVIAIISIVASITMPILFGETNQIEFITAYRKFYSDFSQAVQKISIDEGGYLTNLYPECGYVKGGRPCTSQKFANKLSNYMNVLKVCDASSPDCVGEFKAKYLVKDGYFNFQNNAAYAFVIFNNGARASISFRNSSGQIGEVYVDVNGKKAPNTWGKDVFAIVIKSNGQVKPYSEYNEDKTIITSLICDLTEPTTIGYGCSEWFLYNEKYRNEIE